MVEQTPQLADPNVSGLPEWLGEAFGDNYNEDVIDNRMPTDDEREELQIPPPPVTTIKGLTNDGQHRTPNFIDKVTVAGRMQYGYRFSVVPEN